MAEKTKRGPSDMSVKISARAYRRAQAIAKREQRSIKTTIERAIDGAAEGSKP